MTTELTAVIERVRAFAAGITGCRFVSARSTAYCSLTDSPDHQNFALAADLQALLSAVGEGWELIETAPVHRKILVGSAEWDGPTEAEFFTEANKAGQLSRWVNGPTHWREMPALPPNTTGEK